jgi:hypothetical protein
VALVVLAVGVVFAAGEVAALLLRAGPSSDSVAPVSDVAGNYRVCLLTAAAGQAKPQAVWVAMQKAAATGHVNAQQFPAPARGADSIPYINGVVGVGCDVVVVADDALIPSAENVAAKAKQQRFLIVGAGTAAGNVDVVAGAAEVSGWIAKHVDA